MAIFINKIKKSPYVILDKRFLMDKTLSMKAKGLLAYFLSLPSNWRIRVREVVEHFPDGKHAVYSAVKELRQRGYIIYYVRRNENGSYQPEYDVFEFPEQTKEISSAEKAPVSLSNHLNSPVSIQSHKRNISCNENNLDIGHSLTKNQKLKIKTVATTFAHKIPMDPDTLQNNIEASILNPAHFTLAENDFMKKLNTLKKCLANGLWFPNQTNNDPKTITELNKNEKLKLVLSEYLNEKEHWQNMINLAEKTDKKHLVVDYKNYLLCCEIKIQDLQKQHDFNLNNIQ